MDLSYFPSECCFKKVARNGGGKKNLLAACSISS